MKEKEWVIYLGKAVESFIKDIKGTFPDDTKEHVRNAVKEVMLAFKSLVDEGIIRMEKKKEKKKTRRVKVS